MDLSQTVLASVGTTDGAAIGKSVDALRQLEKLAHENPGSDHVLTLDTVLYALHYGITDEKTHSYRQWLASTIYATLESRVKIVPLAAALNAQELKDRMMKRQLELSPLNHPLLKMLVPGSCTFDQFKLYLRQKFLIMITFWNSIAELALRLSRSPGRGSIDNSAPLFSNVFDEQGEGDVEQAHLMRHMRQMAHMKIPVDFDSKPDFPETKAYINNRLRCMRTPEIAWALGCFFSQEATSLEYTIAHYKLLRHFEVPHEVAEIYEVHEEIDTDHCKDIMEIIMRLIKTKEQQEICIASHAQTLELWNRHFDRVLRLLKEHKS